MDSSLQQKLEKLVAKHEELSLALSDIAVINDQEKYRSSSKEYAQLTPLVSTFRKYQKAEKDLEEAVTMLSEKDDELRALAEQEVAVLKDLCHELELELQTLLLPKDPNDKRNVFLEIRAGTGGDEAAIFAGDLLRMYVRYVENRKWQLEILSTSLGEHGGYKEVIALIRGEGAYSRLKFESGVHRVQRVPKTEAQGRIHTSTCTIAVFPEVEDVEEIYINPADLRVDTFRSSGAGGQHVNVTNSAVRITHIPTGTVVECQEERSQHQNRAKALALLQAKLLANEREKQRKYQAETRRSLVGTGDRSERIRTYNFPQGRLTDHRINLTLYQLEDIMEGALDAVIDPLVREQQAELLAAEYQSSNEAEKK